MNVLVAGGDGFAGRKLATSLQADGHRVSVLTRKDVQRNPSAAGLLVHWDGVTTRGWAGLIEETDAVINMTGRSLAAWPWTKRRKDEFFTSRIVPGRALTAAIREARRRPRLFVQASGINHYGLRGQVADESALAGKDLLARITIGAEEATRGVEDLGVRRIVTRSAIVLDRSDGLLPVMALPVRLFLGGPVAGGKQPLPWIHHADWVGAVRFLMDHEEARGAFALVAPVPTSNAEFYRELTRRLRRPYWLPLPRLLMELTLGEMSVLLTEGRYLRPSRLLALGFEFQFPRLADALANLYV